MRFMSLYRHREESTKAPTQEEMAAMGRLIEQETRSGVLVSTGGLAPSAQGARVRRSGAQITVTDGPFAEAKEVVAGFAIIRAGSKAEAIEAAKRFLGVAGDGICEVRPFFGPDFAPTEPRFMLLWRPAGDERTAGPPSPEHLAEMNRFIAAETKAGVLLATGGLGPTALGARVSRSEGKVAVIDGPFAEAKELIAGFGLFEVAGKEQAIEAAKRFLDVVQLGECEVRPYFGGGAGE